jgi:hypothetical protein
MYWFWLPALLLANVVGAFELDASYDGDGVAYYEPFFTSDAMSVYDVGFGHAALQLPDGRAVFAGPESGRVGENGFLRVLRVKSNGQPDQPYYSAAPEDWGTAIASRVVSPGLRLLSGQRVLVASLAIVPEPTMNRARIARLDGTTGQLDRSFGVDGFAETELARGGRSSTMRLAVDPQGRVLLFASRERTDGVPDRSRQGLHVRRFSAEGVPDATYELRSVDAPDEGSAGLRPITACVLDDGTVFLLATSLVSDQERANVVLRIAAEGTAASFLDWPSLPRRGSVEALDCRGNRVLLAGTTDADGKQRGHVERWDAQGNPDPAFGVDGRVDFPLTASAHGRVLAMAPDASGGTWLAAAEGEGMVLRRLLADGQPGAVGGASDRLALDLAIDSGFSMAMVGGALSIAGYQYARSGFQDGRARPLVLRLLPDAAPGSGASRGLLQIASTHATLIEGAEAIRLPVQRLGGHRGVLRAQYSLIAQPGSGDPSDDVLGHTGELAWADGDVGIREITLQAVDDAIAKSTVAFNLELRWGEDSRDSASDSLRLLVADNDRPVAPPPVAPPPIVSDPPNSSSGGGGALGALDLLWALPGLFLAGATRRRLAWPARRTRVQRAGDPGGPPGRR